MEGITEKLAAFASSFSFNRLSEGQVEQLKLFFLDWLGSAIAGSNETPVRMILRIAKSQGGHPQATLIPDFSKGSSLLASLVNGASSHVVEMDDLHKESVLHPGAAIIPAILAAGESRDCSGKEFIAAMAVGYEVGIRVAIGAGLSHYSFWHTTATCGTFGAAAGAGRVLGLSHQEMAWALGSAGTQASGLWAFLVENAMSKQLHAGKASMNGLLAALLAKEGFTGAKRILESEKGFLRGTSTDYDERRCIDGLGEEFLFQKNSLKYHASCGHTHSAIDAAIQAVQGEKLEPDEISSVRVKIYSVALDLLGNVEANSPYLAKFSLPFCIATALVYGKVGLDAFTQGRIEDRKLRELMDKVEMEEDPDLSALYPQKWPAEVEIRLKGGRVLKGRCDHPKGDPENPLTEREVMEKFSDLTRGIITKERASEISERVMELERLERLSRLFEGEDY